jgi:hypothetical protein
MYTGPPITPSTGPVWTPDNPRIIKPPAGMMWNGTKYVPAPTIKSSATPVGHESLGTWTVADQEQSLAENSYVPPGTSPPATSPPAISTPAFVPSVPNTGGPAANTPLQVFEDVIAPLDLSGIYAILKHYLSIRGLGSLFNDSNGTPSGWLWEQLINGIDTEAELLMALETTVEFRTRFKVIFDLREQALTDQYVYIPSVDEVIAYEKAVSETLRSAGMPAHLYSTTSKLQSYMASQLSASEIEDRVIQVWNTVKGSSADIRDEFSEIIGGDSDAFLAAYILDPESTRVAMEQHIKQSVVGGTATGFGFNLGDSTRDRLADLPMSEAGFSQGFENISQNAPLFNEGMGEVDDLSAEVEGIGMEFEGDSNAITKAEQRLIKRKSLDRAASGGAQSANDGIAGLRGY